MANLTVILEKLSNLRCRCVIFGHTRVGTNGL